METACTTYSHETGLQACRGELECVGREAMAFSELSVLEIEQGPIPGTVFASANTEQSSTPVCGPQLWVISFDHQLTHTQAYSLTPAMQNDKLAF